MSNDSVEDNKGLTGEEEPKINYVKNDKLEKNQGTLNESSETSEISKNNEAHKDGVEGENILEITHNTSIINRSENKNRADIKAFDINQVTNESTIS